MKNISLTVKQQLEPKNLHLSAPSLSSSKSSESFRKLSIGLCWFTGSELSFIFVYFVIEFESLISFALISHFRYLVEKVPIIWQRIFSE